MMKKLLINLLVPSLVTPALAQVSDKAEWHNSALSFFDILPAQAGQLSNVVIDSQVTTAKGSYTRMSMHLSCYATNLRGVGNPVSANSQIIAMIDVVTSSGARQTIKVKFPADYLKPTKERLMAIKSMVAVENDKDFPGVKLSVYDNVLQLLIPNLKEMTITSSGEVTNVSEKNLVVSGIRFAQTGAPGYSTYYGVDGPLSSSVSWYTSKDAKMIDVHASFPGAAYPGQRARADGDYRTGFCGAYYSPLMLFFSDEYPMFTATSSFKLSENQAGSVYWPETSSPGYFLVLDENNDSKILDWKQLFGATDEFKNGFENLAKHDLNKDGVIDSKDKVFKKLKLWNDKNADGISHKSELRSLSSMGVTSIDLKYIYETKKFADRAEYKEKSAFTFTRKGKPQKGQVLDIWFSPAQ